MVQLDNGVLYTHKNAQKGDFCVLLWEDFLCVLTQEASKV